LQLQLAIAHWFANAGCECATEPGAVEELIQGQIQELMEINTTLHMEIMTVRASAEQETTSLQTEVNSLLSLLFDSKTTRLFLKNCRGE